MKKYFTKIYVFQAQCKSFAYFCSKSHEIVSFIIKTMEMIKKLGTK